MSVDVAGDLHGRLHEGVVQVAAGGVLVAFEFDDLDVAEALLIEVGAQEVHDAVRVLVGDEAEVEFHHARGGEDGLAALAVVAAVEAVDVHDGFEVQAGVVLAAVAQGAGDVVGVPQRLAGAGQGGDGVQVGGAGGADVVVETGDQDGAVGAA